MFVRFSELESKPLRTSEVKTIKVVPTQLCGSVDFIALNEAMKRLNEVSYIFKDKDIEGDIKLDLFINHHIVYKADEKEIILSQERI